MRIAAVVLTVVVLSAMTEDVYTQPHHVVAAYYMGDVPVSTIPAQSLTDVIYAFGEPGAGNICRAASQTQNNTFAQLRALRAAHPHLRLLVSIGGWARAPQYSDAALTPRSRAAFARSCVDAFVKAPQLDGLDVDWEFPVHGGVPQNPHRPQDRNNVTALMLELRSQLDALGRANHRHYYLTIATPTGRWQYGGRYDPSDSYDLAAIARIADWLNVMTYDMNNIFSPYSSFNAPMYEDPNDPTPKEQSKWDNVTGAVRYYEQHGVPADKIVLGMAFYGRGFSGVSSKNAGLYSKFKSGFPETPWRNVKQQFFTDKNWQRHWSATAQAPWLYNRKTNVFFSYDDPHSMAIKATFVRSAHLRGSMFWVFGEDDDQASLLRALTGGGT
ncbi:MAG: glycoside hydrolase family 18 protein [Candidatus Eremiobacteraeota bacterium]|nr:glycoside hydrolase family 18 protein [Candidatus Eremiobacteraeota bacterium]